MKIFVAGIVVYFCLFLGANEGSASLLDENCGITSRPSRFRRVVGGQDAKRFSNPWMVMVLHEDQFRCGGSLITSRFVLTAAQCVSASTMKVRLGVHDMDISENTNEINIDRSIVHSQHGIQPYNYDIALLRMAQEVAFSDYIRPICLLVNEEVERTSPTFKLTGWGKTENGEMSNILQTTNLQDVNISYCKHKFGLSLDQSHICAGSLTSDSCTGDSGSPLSAELSYQETNRVFQFGIVSFGSLSCRSFAVYTNVTHFLGWVTNLILLNSDFSI
ncbi:serine protease grass-like [Drosophila takahashii]|uniref:serine protease grass-like n=1 Tax=Drosophila takahashii TaxID=29030 RepID=UPI0038993FC7